MADKNESTNTENTAEIEASELNGLLSVSEERKEMTFTGCDGGWFGDGEFTVGKSYKIVEGPDYYESGIEPDAAFIDDNGKKMWEELQFFE